MAYDPQRGQARTATLVDVLDRVLDKGLVVAGDIKVSIAEVELLTIRLRLLVCSLDKAQEIGLDWWKYDRYFSPRSSAAAVEGAEMKRQIAALERKVARLAAGGTRRPARRSRGAA